MAYNFKPIPPGAGVTEIPAPIVYQRTKPFPLDNSVLFSTLADAQAYIATPPPAGTSYLGQMLAVIVGNVTTAYVVSGTDATKTLVKLASLQDITDSLVNYYTKTEIYTKIEVNNLIDLIPKFKVLIVASLPTTGVTLTLYLVPSPGGSGTESYDEYVWVEKSAGTFTYEHIGSTTIDISSKEDISNKVESITELNKSSTTLYPSLKALTDYVGTSGDYVKLDGTSKMVVGYNPTDPLQVATVGVVDSKIKITDVKVNGTSVVTDKVANISITGQTKSITHTALTALYTSKTLDPGGLYRITDYSTVVGTLTGITSAGNPFDLIVRAISNEAFDANAEAVLHVGTSYFRTIDMSRWTIKYDITNNTSLYNWASAAGKGVIYYMKDANGNEAPWDFKNILFNGRYAFNTSAVKTDGTNIASTTHTNNRITINAVSGQSRMRNISISSATMYNNIIGADATIIATGMSNCIIEGPVNISSLIFTNISIYDGKLFTMSSSRNISDILVTPGTFDGGAATINLTSFPTTTDVLLKTFYRGVGGIYMTYMDNTNGIYYKYDGASTWTLVDTPDINNLPYVKLDGTSAMAVGYVPSLPLNVATKSYVDASIGGGGFSVQVIGSLPITGDPKIMYLVLAPTAQQTPGNLYNEFLWVNSKWENVGSREVLTKAVVSAGSEVGGVSSGTTFPVGTPLEDVIKQILVKELEPSISSPILSITATTQKLEAGSKLPATLPITTTFTNGQFNPSGWIDPGYNKATGITTTPASLKVTFDGRILINNGTMTGNTNTVTIGTVTPMSLGDITASATVGHSASSTIPLTNLGTPAPTVTIPAANIGSTTLTWEGRQRVWFGSSPIAITLTTSAQIRAITNSVLDIPQEATTGTLIGKFVTITMNVGDMSAYVAYPQSWGAVKGIYARTNGNQDNQNSFASSTVVVQGADSYVFPSSSGNYNVRILTGAAVTSPVIYDVCFN